MAGPYYFAWVDVGTPFDEVAHTREDEDIFALEIDHNEGDFPVLHIDVRNPKVGLLAAGRQLWCWLSWDSGPEIVPLFTGRLIGIPERMQDEIVRLTFLAKPEDFKNQKASVANSMKVLPWYDPVWVTETNDSNPDTVLETRSMLWHIDRLTLEVTASDIIIGEDDTLAVGEGDHFYDSLDVTYSDRPLKTETVAGTVEWTQTGSGTIDLSRAIQKAFADNGSAYAFPLISTLTADGLLQSWPKPGASIGGGWSVSNGSVIVDATINKSAQQPPAWQGTNLNNRNFRTQTYQSGRGWIKPYVFTVNYYNGLLHNQGSDAAGTDFVLDVTNSIFKAWGSYSVDIPIGVFAVRFLADWQASRKRTETIRFVLEADVADPGGINEDLTADSISLSSQLIDQAVDPGGLVPMGDTSRDSYFQTDRGIQSFEYLILLARAKLRARARCVSIKFQIPWELGVALTCRQNIALGDNRLPGGVATGKVINYTLRADEQGQVAEVTIGCTVGRNGSVVPVAGVGVHHDDYSDGYEVYAGSTALAGSGDVAYETLGDFDTTSAGLSLQNLSAESAVQSIEITGGFDAQVATIVAHKAGNYADPLGALAQLPTHVKLSLFPVAGGTFHTELTPEMSKLAVPRTVDLEAV